MLCKSWAKQPYRSCNIYSIIASQERLYLALFSLPFSPCLPSPLSSLTSSSYFSYSISSSPSSPLLLPSPPPLISSSTLHPPPPPLLPPLLPPPLLSPSPSSPPLLLHLLFTHLLLPPSLSPSPLYSTLLFSACVQTVMKTRWSIIVFGEMKGVGSQWMTKSTLRTCSNWLK